MGGGRSGRGKGGRRGRGRGSRSRSRRCSGSWRRCRRTTTVSGGRCRLVGFVFLYFLFGRSVGWVCVYTYVHVCVFLFLSVSMCVHMVYTCANPPPHHTTQHNYPHSPLILGSARAAVGRRLPPRPPLPPPLGHRHGGRYVDLNVCLVWRGERVYIMDIVRLT